jgi:hypothetical protein
MAKRPNWSRPLPETLIIPKLMTLETLADVRKLLAHLPAETRTKELWLHVAAKLKEATVGADTLKVAITLRMALNLEGVPCRPKRRPVRNS